MLFIVFNNVVDDSKYVDWAGACLKTSVAVPTFSIRFSAWSVTWLMALNQAHNLDDKENGLADKPWRCFFLAIVPYHPGYAPG